MVTATFELRSGHHFPDITWRPHGFHIPRTIAQLTRFALVGGLSNIVYLAAFMGLAFEGPQLANAIGVVLSTVLANELHRRVTFDASARVGWFAAQWEGGALALAGLIFSAAALAVVKFFVPHADALMMGIAVIAVSALVGLVRFVALRGWVFATGH